MEKVAHGVNENKFWLLPEVGNTQCIFVQGEIKAVPVFLQAHAFEAPGHNLCVAEFTPGRNLRTPGGRVPGHFGPFNG